MKITVNGKQFKVPDGISPDTRLVDYLRNVLGLKGTKAMCREGGCGSCVVTICKKNASTGELVTKSINSCLATIASVQDYHITTVEGLGGQKHGFHEIQSRIAAYNGSQCGYCTPGMVMNLYGALCKKASSDEKELEACFDGNLCRCTGYRPILDTAKSFANEKNIIDIEELGRVCSTVATQAILADEIPKLEWGKRLWLKPRTLQQLLDLQEKYVDCDVQLVAGNTSTGIFKDETRPTVTINISEVKELQKFEATKDCIEIGAGVTLQNLIDELEKTANDKSVNENGQFLYLIKDLCPLLRKIAGTPIRNIGTWAGNLMLKHRQRSFPSDLFTAVDGLGALLCIAKKSGVTIMTPSQLLDADMNHAVIVSVKLPAISENERYHTCKIMPRKVNAHAYINAAFYTRLSSVNSVKTIEVARIRYGGLSEDFLKATKTEEALAGQTLNAQLIRNALVTLENEIVIGVTPVETSREYRLSAARNILFKFLKCAMRTKSREEFYDSIYTPAQVTKASYEFERVEEKFPYCEPMPKLDSILQASGEVEYVADRPVLQGELHAALVLSDYAKATIDGIDCSAALAKQGVEYVLTAKDITGENAVRKFKDLALKALAEGTVEYAGQPVAMVLAETRELAVEAVQLVEVKYSNIQVPMVTIRDSIENNYFHEVKQPAVAVGDAESVFDACEHKITGEASVDSQYHFYMETHAYLCKLEDDRLEVWATSQTPGQTQETLHIVTGLAMANIHVNISRLGGAFGGKGESSDQLGSLAAVGCLIANRPVRLVTSLEDCMRLTGKRFPVLAKYKAGADKDGFIKAIIVDYFMDFGYFPEGGLMFFLDRGLKYLDNSYNIPNWKITGYAVKTDKPYAVVMRAPDEIPPAFIMETILEHVAFECRTDSVALRTKHFVKNGDMSLKGVPYADVSLHDIWKQLMNKLDFAQTMSAINEFNTRNKWRKRGFSAVPAKFVMGYGTLFELSAFVSIYPLDGTVVVQQGGVEMGQGITTKVIQVAAKTLGIPVDMVKVRPVSTATCANNMVTAASVSSEMVCRSVLECCKELKQRIDKVREQMSENASWQGMLKKAYLSGVDLSAQHRFTKYKNPQGGKYAYNVFGAVAVVSEVDILTGEATALQMDGVFDLGESANPLIDVGQIEGALVMGMGYFMQEKELYDKVTGRILTPGTWEYKPPTAHDIPRVMNVTLFKNTPNVFGVMPSKAVGEPPILSSPAFLFAAKNAVNAFRAQHNNTDYFALNQPATADCLLQHCQVDLASLLDDLENE